MLSGFITLLHILDMRSKLLVSAVQTGKVRVQEPANASTHANLGVDGQSSQRQR